MNAFDELIEDRPVIEVFIIHYNGVKCPVHPSNLLNAVNYCFKLLYVLNYEWPPECKHIYEFLQGYLFKIELKKLKSYSVCNRLEAEIESYRN